MRKAKAKERLTDQEAIKAIIKADIPHADVALRGIAAVLKNAELRLAVEAAACSEVPNAVKDLICEQFSPGGDEGLEKAVASCAKTLDGSKLLKAINARALEIASSMLTDRAIEDIVADRVRSQIHAIVAAALGLRVDSWDRVEVDDRRNSSIVSKINVMASEEVDKLLPAILTDLDMEKLVKSKAKKAESAVREAYQYAVEEHVRKTVVSWATKRARKDLSKIMGAELPELGDEE